MKLLSIGNGKVAKLDDSDFERVNMFRWYAHRSSNRWYVRRNVFLKREDGKSKTKTIFLHRFIVNAPHEMIVDHVDGDGLNCQRKNLRITDKVGNGRNRVVSKNAKSRLKCVGITRYGFQAYIKVNKKLKHLGHFKDKIEAAKAYNEAAKKYFGEFSNLNPI